MTEPCDVVMHLSVGRAQSIGAAFDGLWERTVRMAFLPMPVRPRAAYNDLVMIWPSDEGLDEGLLWPVRRRYWRFDGTAVLELVGMQVDPGERMLRHCDGRYLRSWLSARDGAPEPRLEAAGWISV